MSPGASDAIPTPVARACPAWRTRSSLLLGGLVLAAVLSTRWVRVNISPSMPYGLYRLTAVREPLARGMVVVVPVPASVQAWHARWVPLLKPVAAVAGDEVCIWKEGVWIEGQFFGPVYREASGMALPTMRGCVVVQDDEVFLASGAPRSLDGRYLGVTPVAILTAQAVPLLTWR